MSIISGTIRRPKTTYGERSASRLVQGKGITGNNWFQRQSLHEAIGKEMQTFVSDS